MESGSFRFDFHLVSIMLDDAASERKRVKITLELYDHGESRATIKGEVTKRGEEYFINNENVLDILRNRSYYGDFVKSGKIKYI